MFGCKDAGRNNIFIHPYNINIQENEYVEYAWIYIKAYVYSWLYNIYTYTYIQIHVMYIHIQSTSKVNHLMLPGGSYM